MAEDFGYCWRTVRLYCPAAPTFLAREWVNAAYKQLLGARHWGFLRKEVVVTPLTTDIYLTVPADFGSWKIVVDKSRQVKICFYHSLDQLQRVDPAGTTTGPVLALVAATPDPTSGLARYYYYPHGAVSTLTCIYNRQGDRLDDTTLLTGVLANGAEVLVAGALAQAALWPGTPDKPNPYFNAGLAQAKANEFRIGIQTLSLRDDEQYPDDLWDNWPECECGLDGYGGDYRTTDASVYYY